MVEKSNKAESEIIEDRSTKIKRKPKTSGNENDSISMNGSGMNTLHVASFFLSFLIIQTF